MGLFDEISKNLGALTGGQNNDGQNQSKGSGMGGLLGSAAVGGILGALLGGSKGVQRTARNAAVIGAGAGAAALAYKLYQKWRSNQDAPAPTTPTPTASAPGYSAPNLFATATPAPALDTAPTDDKAVLLIEAMVFAARADGHIDSEEQQLILKSAQELGGNGQLEQVVSACMQKPLDPADIARRVSTPEEAADVYFLSAVIVNPDTFMEKSYLRGLAQACNLSEAQKAEIDARAAQARASLLQ
ncbi:MAG: tellurite resistance TerB family protein [Candidatus Anaerobiospirillum merdipullorum]|uniref:Tellurite resistance TerB family protein n=1 Tax=Candidatus Anaerobiospirillum merdipullorum TaxID=2838450 RepID=A0A9E2KMT7_9GAMM|nr:tellurite resistance TerB family protein [Candidatus Anaerobiospirillum merdipullorum]